MLYLCKEKVLSYFNSLMLRNYSDRLGERGCPKGCFAKAACSVLWKSFGLAQRVGFNRLLRAEAGL